jgi:hypothetical protein
MRTARSARSLALAGVVVGLLIAALAARADADPNPADAACQAAVLQQPGNIKGFYQSMTNPNNHWYTETFSLPSVASCTGVGVRVVQYFQEADRHGKSWFFTEKTFNPITGVSASIVKPKANSDIYTVTTDQAKNVHGFFRAPHFCVYQGPGLTNSDKKQGVEGRPTVEITWKPADGTALVTQYFNGPASKLCK